MDAGAYLQRHGWRGSGTPLGQSGRGITKPLLVSQKQNVLGVGATTKATQWDQWWSTSLDSSLQKLQVARKKAENPNADSNEQKRKPASEPPHPAPAQVGQKGLYGGFVKGPGLGGTFPAAKDQSGDAPVVESEAVEEIAKGDAVLLQGSKLEARRKRKKRKKVDAARMIEDSGKAGVTNLAGQSEKSRSFKSKRTKETRRGTRKSEVSTEGLEPILVSNYG